MLVADMVWGGAQSDCQHGACDCDGELQYTSMTASSTWQCTTAFIIPPALVGIFTAAPSHLRRPSSSCRGALLTSAHCARSATSWCKAPASFCSTQNEAGNMTSPFPKHAAGAAARGGVGRGQQGAQARSTAASHVAARGNRRPGARAAVLHRNCPEGGCHSCRRLSCCRACQYGAGRG